MYTAVSNVNHKKCKKKIKIVTPPPPPPTQFLLMYIYAWCSLCVERDFVAWGYIGFKNFGIKSDSCRK